MIAQDRLQELADGRYYYGFKRQWKNGARGIYFVGPDLLERLAALVPPPRKHQVRYHGVYAPRSRLFAAVRQMTSLVTTENEKFLDIRIGLKGILRSSHLAI